MDKIEKVKEILASHGITMDVGGCGCCGSPWVKLTYNGELIINDDNSAFTMHSPD